MVSYHRASAPAPVAAICAAVLLALAVTLASCTSAGSKAQVDATGAIQPARDSTSGATMRPIPTKTKTTPKPPTKTDSDGDTPVRLPIPHGNGPAGSVTSTGLRGVALTFDDGPDPRYTPIVLDLLKRYDVKATFCVVGFRARDYPDLIRRIVAEGHTLCNHSWQHLLDLGRHPDSYIRHDLQQTNDAIHRAVPGAKIRYFRAPGGNFDHHLVALAASMGMTALYWGVDPQDWNSARYGHGYAMRRHIISSVEKNTRPGSIILSHDLNKPDTIDAYRTLLPRLKEQFVLIALPT